MDPPLLSGYKVQPVEVWRLMGNDAKQHGRHTSCEVAPSW